MTEMLWHFLLNNFEVVIIGAFTLIQISPIKVNPWGAIVRWLKQEMIGDVSKKVDAISEKVDATSKKVDALEDRMEEDKASQARNHILRFADELYDGKHHSQEYFLQMLDDVKTYESYCETHPKFPNGRTVNACEKIRSTYDSLWQNHKF